MLCGPPRHGALDDSDSTGVGADPLPVTPRRRLAECVRSDWEVTGGSPAVKPMGISKARGSTRGRDLRRDGSTAGRRGLGTATRRRSGCGRSGRARRKTTGPRGRSPARAAEPSRFRRSASPSRSAPGDPRSTRTRPSWPARSALACAPARMPPQTARPSSSVRAALASGRRRGGAAVPAASVRRSSRCTRRWRAAPPTSASAMRRSAHVAPGTIASPCSQQRRQGAACRSARRAASRGARVTSAPLSGGDRACSRSFAVGHRSRTRRASRSSRSHPSPLSYVHHVGTGSSMPWNLRAQAVEQKAGSSRWASTGTSCPQVPHTTLQLSITGGLGRLFTSQPSTSAAKSARSHLHG